MECRVLESKKCAITQGANNTNHIALDLVKEGYMLDYIVAHSEGTIIALQDGLGNMKGTNSYGNYVKIDHGNGYCTLYAHMQKGLPVKNGQFVKKDKD
jgi:murein DD-endopeptidase MepM/ murein hydrolase activator NlpD